MTTLANLPVTTELEAVNAILLATGESPVNALTNEFDDGYLARTLLTEETRRAQLYDWGFNTDEDYPLTRAADGFVYLPRGTFRVVVFDKPEYVMRGNRIYDKSNRTFTFPASTTITANILRTYLPFEYLPDALKLYIVTRAGRRFQDQMGGDNVVHRFHKDDEYAAWSMALNDEAEASQLNALDSSYLSYRLRAGRPRFGLDPYGRG